MPRYRLKLVKSLPNDYGGMNCYAAKDLNIKYPYPCSTVIVTKDQSKKNIRETYRHEVIESEIMRVTKLPYKKAHKLTTEIEKIK
jgi:hypothetical protein